MCAARFHHQIPLDIGLRDDLTFDNYYCADNVQVVSDLKAFTDSTDLRGLVLCAEPGSGKTHLFQAMTQSARKLGKQAIYLPMREWVMYGEESVQSVENYELICLDDLDEISGNRAWEEAVFHLLNRAWALGHRVAMSLSTSISDISWVLPDLKSRLEWGLVCRLKQMKDQDKINALQLRAVNRGIQIPEETVRYIFTHLPRDMSQLFEFLETLDTASLQAQRRLTVPFIKKVLNGEFHA